MGPDEESLALARKLLKDHPRAKELEVDLAYALTRLGERWIAVQPRER